MAKTNKRIQPQCNVTVPEGVTPLTIRSVRVVVNKIGQGGSRFRTVEECTVFQGGRCTVYRLWVLLALTSLRALPSSLGGGRLPGRPNGIGARGKYPTSGPQTYRCRAVPGLLAGLLPFSAIGFELQYILARVWGGLPDRRALRLAVPGLRAFG